MKTIIETINQGKSERLRPSALLFTTTLAGLYGAAISWIPAPHDPGVFWVSNLFAPWLAIAFLAGCLQAVWKWAVTAGILAEVTCLVAFYSRQFGSGFGIGSWVHYIVLGPPPWGLIAVPAGLVYGALGWWRNRSRSVVAGWALGLPCVAEPWVWPLYEGFLRRPLELWLAETVLGAVVIAWVTMTWKLHSARAGHST